MAQEALECGTAELRSLKYCMPPPRGAAFFALQGCDVKPVLQALILAEKIYEDKKTGKKVLAGTFNSLMIGQVQVMSTDEFSSEFAVTPQDWERPENSYVCSVRCIPEDVGFSVVSLDLPGVASQGETADEALANIREALAGAIRFYLDRDGKVPWDHKYAETIEPSAVPDARVLVNA